MNAISVDFDVMSVIHSSLLVNKEMIMGSNQYTEKSIAVKFNLPLAAGVYRLRDTISGAEYVGSSTRIRYRIAQHFWEIKHPETACGAYNKFIETYKTHGLDAFEVDILLLCAEKDLKMYERLCVQTYAPSENTQYKPYTKEACAERSRRTTELWKNPEYRARAVAARKGNTFSKGYKCTPEQIENRKRAARISNMKRNYGDQWVEEYMRRYPEHVGDIDGLTVR